MLRRTAITDPLLIHVRIVVADLGETVPAVVAHSGDLTGLIGVVGLFLVRTHRCTGGGIDVAAVVAPVLPDQIGALLLVRVVRRIRSRCRGFRSSAQEQPHARSQQQEAEDSDHDGDPATPELDRIVETLGVTGQLLLGALVVREDDVQCGQLVVEHLLRGVLADVELEVLLNVLTFVDDRSADRIDVQVASGLLDQRGRQPVVVPGSRESAVPAGRLVDRGSGELLIVGIGQGAQIHLGDLLGEVIGLHALDFLLVDKGQRVGGASRQIEVEVAVVLLDAEREPVLQALAVGEANAVLTGVDLHLALSAPTDLRFGSLAVGGDAVTGGGEQRAHATRIGPIGGRGDGLVAIGVRVDADGVACLEGDLVGIGRVHHEHALLVGQVCVGHLGAGAFQ